MTTDTTALQPGVYVAGKDTAQPTATTTMTTSTTAPQTQPQPATLRAHGHDEQTLYNRARVVAAERALRRLQRENDTLKRSELVARHERQRLRSLVDTLRSELEAMGSTVAQQTATMMALSGVMRRSDPYHLVKERRQQAVSSARATHMTPSTDAVDAAMTTTRNATTTTTAEGGSSSSNDEDGNATMTTRQLAEQLHTLQQQYDELTRVHDDDVARIAQLQRQVDQLTATAANAATTTTPQANKKHSSSDSKDDVARVATATRRTRREPEGIERDDDVVGHDNKTAVVDTTPAAATARRDNDNNDDNKAVTTTATAAAEALSMRSVAHGARHRAARELPRVVAALGTLCMHLLSCTEASGVHGVGMHTTHMSPRQQGRQDDDDDSGAHVFAVQLRVLSCHQLSLPHDEHGGDDKDMTLAARRVCVRVRGPLGTTLTQTRPVRCVLQHQQQQQQRRQQQDEDESDCADELADDVVSCAVQYDAASSMSCSFCTLHTTAWSVCLDVYCTTASQHGQRRREEAHTQADAAVLLGSAVVPVSALVSAAARPARSSRPRRVNAHKQNDSNDDHSDDEGSGHDDDDDGTNVVVRSVHTATLLSSPQATAATAVAMHTQRRRDTDARATARGSGAAAATVVGVVCFDCAIRNLTTAAATATRQQQQQQQCARRVQCSSTHTPRDDAAHVTAASHAAATRPPSAACDTKTTADTASVLPSPPPQEQQQQEQEQLLRVYVKEGRGLMDDAHDDHGNGVALDALRVCAPRVLVWLDDTLLCTVPEAAMSGPHPRWPASSSSVCLVRVQQQQQQQQQSTTTTNTATAGQMLRFEVQDVDEAGIDPMGMATLSVARALQSPGTHELPVMLHRVQYGSLLVEVTPRNDHHDLCCIMRNLKINLDAITRGEDSDDDDVSAHDDDHVGSSSSRAAGAGAGAASSSSSSGGGGGGGAVVAIGVSSKARREGLCEDGVRVGSLLISAHGLRTSTGSSYVLSLKDLQLLSAAEGGFLGCGSSGAVRRAVHRVTGQLVALKEIKYTSTAHLSEIRRELETLHGVTAAYNNNNNNNSSHSSASNCNCTTTTACSSLVDFYGAFCYEGSVFIAMECLDGSLDALRCAVPHDVLAHLTRRVLHGLTYLHRVRHLIHRDLKPSNVLFRYDTGDVKISDFGVSSQLECTKGGAHSFVGTVTYMSPERLKGDVYSYAADVWSLGLVVAELAMGVCPFAALRGDSTEARFWALLQHLSHSHAPALELPATLEHNLTQFILACTHKSPEQRPTCVALLSHPFITMYCGNGNADEAAEAAADRAVIRTWLCSIRPAAATTTMTTHATGQQQQQQQSPTTCVRDDVDAHDAAATQHSGSGHSSNGSCRSAKDMLQQQHHRHRSRHGDGDECNNNSAVAAHDVAACARCSNGDTDVYAAAAARPDAAAYAATSTHVMDSTMAMHTAQQPPHDASPLNLDDELTKLLL